MAEGDQDITKIMKYMRAHWPSEVKEEWQVGLKEYPEIVRRAMEDLTLAATQNRRLIRLAGISGSGKTTQILPAVEEYCESKGYEPILMAARRFVEYHPHYEEILEFYGEENLRKMTDEFATIMLFLTLSELIRGGYDIVLDVTLLDPEMEGILLKLLDAAKYEMWILMIAVSPVVTEKYLAGRAWRHSKETELEFIRATGRALEFYAGKAPETRIVLWSVYNKEPVYDGSVKGCLEVFDDYSARTELPANDDDERREAKIRYLAG